MLVANSRYKVIKIIHRGKPPALPGDSQGFDLCRGHANVEMGAVVPSLSRGGLRGDGFER